jgi:hypothetical protein
MNGSTCWKAVGPLTHPLVLKLKTPKLAGLRRNAGVRLTIGMSSHTTVSPPLVAAVITDLEVWRRNAEAYKILTQA